jgi:hypothetical protein
MYHPMTLDTSTDGDGNDNGDDDEYNVEEDCKLLRYLQILAALAHAFATTAVAVAPAAAAAAAATAAAAAAAADTAPSLPPPPPKLLPPTAAFFLPPFLDLNSFYLLLTFLKSSYVYSRELLYSLFMLFVQS